MAEDGPQHEQNSDPEGGPVVWVEGKRGDPDNPPRLVRGIKNTTRGLVTPDPDNDPRDLPTDKLNQIPPHDSLDDTDNNR